MIIHAIDVKDFKGIKQVRLQDLKPGLIIVTGKNGAGKSSLLDAIEQGLRGGKAVCAKPIREGATKAEVQFDLGELEVRRTWTQGKAPIVKVRNKKNRTTAGQAVLDMLLNARTMDPTTFLKLDKKKQADELQKAMGVDFSEVDGQIAEKYDERTHQGRLLDSAKGAAEHATHHDDAPKAEFSLLDLTGELADMNKLKASVDAATARVAGIDKDVAAYDADLEAIAKRVAEINKAKKALASHREAAAATLKADQELFDKCRSIDTIEDDIANIETQNQKARDNKAHAKALAEVERLEKVNRDLTDGITSLRKKREAMLQEAKFPLPDVSITEEGITMKGVPLEQCSQAEQLRVGFEIARLIAPDLKVTCCREGSNLDDDALKFLLDLAISHEFQFWIEMVRTDDDTALEIVAGELGKV